MIHKSHSGGAPVTTPERLKQCTPASCTILPFSASVWRELLFVCRYFLVNPRPGVYARELPIGLDTKFVERHEGILRNLLDFLLPDSAKTDAPHFEQRFGLKYEEPQIRFRILGEAMPIAASLPFTDVAVPLSQFASLGWSDLTIVIVENKRTFHSQREILMPKLIRDGDDPPKPSFKDHLGDLKKIRVEVSFELLSQTKMWRRLDEATQATVGRYTAFRHQPPLPGR